MSDELEFARLKEIFEAADTSGDGLLCYGEIESLVQQRYCEIMPADIVAIKGILNLDDAKDLDFDGFLSFMNYLKKNMVARVVVAGEASWKK